jgi:hypothetical protein
MEDPDVASMDELGDADRGNVDEENPLDVAGLSALLLPDGKVRAVRDQYQYRSFRLHASLSQSRIRSACSLEEHCSLRLLVRPVYLHPPPTEPPLLLRYSHARPNTSCDLLYSEHRERVECPARDSTGAGSITASGCCPCLLRNHDGAGAGGG